MVNILLHVESKQTPLAWDQFVATKPPYSIALDGYVFGATKFKSTKLGPYANFNHHEEVDRISTRATCAQVLISLRLGFLEAFRKNDDITMHIYVNDCDQDVCLSYFILHNHLLCLNTINPIINRLVHMEDMMDTCSGAYPFSMDMPTLGIMAWIFEPYTSFRMSGGIERKNDEEFKFVIEAVEQRIQKHYLGESNTVAMNMSYKQIGGGKDWSMVIEEGFNARTAMMANGIKAFISVRDRGDGFYTYSIGKMSNYIPFDVYTILNELDKHENNSMDHWGGSNTIGGSPRVSGSHLSPVEVEKIVNDYLCQENY